MLTLRAALGDRAGEIGARDLVVGQPWTSALPEALTVVTPSGRRIALAADDDGVRRFTDTFEPGHYRVERGEASDADAGAAAPLLFTVNVDASESETLPQVIAPPSLAGDRVLAAASVPRWRPLVGLAALVLLLESLLRLRRRSRALAALRR